METFQLTRFQLYSGFIGLRPEQVLSRHPLGAHMHFNGKYDLGGGMTSLEYYVDSSLFFLFILEDGRISVQRTYADSVSEIFSSLYHDNVGDGVPDSEFMINIPQGRVRVTHLYEPGGLECLVIGDF